MSRVHADEQIVTVVSASSPADVLIEDGTELVVVADGSPTEVVLVAEPAQSAEVITAGVQGPPGRDGADGGTGPQGPPGADGAGTLYEHEQSSPAALWTINHNLGRRPAAVRFVDSAGTEFLAGTRDVSPNVTEATVKPQRGGFAYVL